MSLKDIRIGNRIIGTSHPPLIIAELSGNHGQSLDRALEMVEIFAKTGAHAVKLQTYTADTMTLDLDDNEFFISDSESLWKGESLYSLYAKASTPWEWHKPIFDLCRKLDVLGFSTPFDDSAVDFLEDLNTPCYKIASFENIDLPLIKKVASTKKPTIISTGMATKEELEESVQAFRDGGGTELILLKCTSAYPAPAEAANLNTIKDLSESFSVHAGLSDHTLGIAVPIAATVLGARVIEKHVTLSRKEGVDSAFSLEPHEFEQMVTETNRAFVSQGSIAYGPGEDKKNLVFRRSLYICEDLKKGDLLTEQNVRRIRPGLGLMPKHWDEVIGKKINQDVKRGTPVQWDLLS